MKKRWILAGCMAALVLGGCGAKEDQTQLVDLTEQETSGAEEAAAEPTEDGIVAESEDDAGSEIDATQDTVDTDTDDDASEDETAQTEAAGGGTFSYQDVSRLEFYFASGAGGWDTVLHIGSDGSFSGLYHDSDMGDTGDGYPNGTLYWCEFTGQFGELTQVNDYTYWTTIEWMEYKNPVGTEEILDDMLYVYSPAYGLDEAQTLYFYLEGAPMDELPEPFMEWVYWPAQEAEDGGLPFIGLYNEAAENGFSSYEAMVDAYTLQERLREVENKTDILVARLGNGDLTQTEMNMTSYEIYETWDGLLNEIWGYLKDTMDADAFAALTEEERAWVADKEAAVKAAGEENAGGSLQPLLENDTAGEWTKERVYELMKYVE